jgi:putative tryptophan/tyrosine transport system substrate-binding protein
MHFDQLKRREVLTLLGGAAAAWPFAAHAQQPAMPLIGLLELGSPEALANRVGAFRKGLSEAGFVEGQNVAIEYRWAYNDYNQLPELAADLVRRRVALIATLSMPAALVAKGATTTIPIVFSAAGDPVQTGLVASLNRPGGNVTGVTDFGVALAAKRLGLLHELLPRAARFAVLVNRGVSPSIELLIREVQAAATVIGQQVDVLSAANSHEIDAAFATLLQTHADALMVSPQALFMSRRAQILTQTARHAVPAMYPDRDFVEAGGLMSYGSNTFDRVRQTGLYAGRVLKGEKPSDLPIMRTTKFELVINLQTAKVLGFEVPPTLLARADEVIE